MRSAATRVGRLFEAMGQHGLGMGRRPAIGKHRFQAGIVGMQSQEEFSDVRPRLDAMTFRARRDGVQHGRLTDQSLRLSGESLHSLV